MEPNSQFNPDENHSAELTYLPTLEQLALTNDLMLLMDRLYSSPTLIQIHQQVTDFSNKLEDKYGLEVLGHCELWHILILSSIGPHVVLNRHDFSGEDSIALFVKQLANSELTGDDTSKTP